ncbi:MAG: DUF2141 domain-containing protein [Sphingomonadaceae bacterium]|nr:DUF2141 domain-containing protein [Sphingomonadaceae bacterium]
MVCVSPGGRAARAVRPLLLLVPPLLAATTSVAATASAGAPVEIEVANVRSAEGVIRIDICTERQFLRDCNLSAAAPAHIGSVTLTLPSVPPGRYAIQAFHDRNGNGKVDRNFLGIPTEPVGFSNDAPLHMGPPKFAVAAFDHGIASQHLTLHLTSKFF